jgi:hypothetical protein
MPLQNRVSPTGEIFRTPARGAFMGNRGGAIHDGQREIVRAYASRRWIACVLEFRGRHRVVMSPGRYTELFFLDEAVALAAGHRPCAECRRERFNAFKKAWIRAGNAPKGTFLYAEEIDLALHRARIDQARRKVTFRAPLKSLPDGCFVQLADGPYLVWGDTLRRWSSEGYSQPRARVDGETVTVLTPAPIVACLGHGYCPEISTEEARLA